MSKSADKILKTAEQLFNQQSFSGVGVDLIRDESGCSKTTLYTYYSNKHQLVQSVLQARDQRFRESLQAAVDGLQGVDALKKIYDWHIEWFQSDHFKGCLFVRAVGESSPNDHSIIAIAQQHKQWVRSLIQTQTLKLKRGQDITQLMYLQLEGLINQFLVEGFQAQTAAMSRALIFDVIESFQTQTEDQNQTP
ncbi:MULTISPECIES: TetR family transcriptional regulator [Acinetobacter]|jgi:AcrR family transcriptional regulator|uniref:TetR/AcrR family transcriptional regulator n=2 Tax=Acinetobacter TaxID=469 RepID=A0A4Q7AS26_9GAMM|nr:MULTISPECIES: TetR family transcriptional regulator [Acinetobacter]MCW8038840.1 TetR/AcrR family transcriptional regulator [Acinetobacter entericus]RZG66115.1 TetR/AcrR family transcriptional regulator [Acinetobacter bouvetii]TCB74185.1 TetR/AcrR family transcriptional regulator [Acinetobacter sp. ANC 4177]